jgi:aminomuconate-semialdehyde/2-hydroxymuconate-6-semialdehyde dehydrogenase
MRRLTNFIAGEHRQPASGQYLPVLEPGTGAEYAQVPASDDADINAAVTAAKAAFPAWSSTTSDVRSRALLKLADLIERDLEAFAKAESDDVGKPISLARTVDIPRSAANFRYFATAILHQPGDLHLFDGSAALAPGAISPAPAINYTLRKPRGVAGLIAPWNLPLHLLTWKIAPALATGNTCVCKPSEVTPMTAAMLADRAAEAGIPPGVLNIIHGRGDVAGGALVKHPDVPTVSFTGSTGVGRWIGRECGERLKRVSLELGGKNAMLVFEDAELEKTLDLAARAAFSNSGQICLCTSRLLVHESLFDRFVAGLVARARALRIGDPQDPATQLGSVVSGEHLAKIDAMVALARQSGATIHTGGAPVASDALPPRCRRGFFYQPTVMTGLDAACRVEQEEIFGPVVSVAPFRDEAEALALANGTSYGLAGVICTSDLSRAHRVAAALDAGVIWVNCWMVRDLRTPFGGMKQSGVGREGGLDALKFFTEPKNICIQI